MEPRWLDADERAAWLRLVAVVELLPGALDGQLRRDSQLSHFEYFVLAMLSEAPERRLRMTSLAQRTNATLPRLSSVSRWGLRRPGAALGAKGKRQRSRLSKSRPLPRQG